MNYKPKLVSDNNDMVHEIDAQTKAILVELTSDGKIVFYVDGQKGRCKSIYRTTQSKY